MLWKEVKSWAKEKGYTATKDKEDGKYYWAKFADDGSSISGVEKSVSKLAKAIYNHITDNKWVDHQQEHINNLEEKRISVTDYGT